MDIGTLTGAIAIEDQFSSVFDMAIHKVSEFAEDFEGAMGAAVVGATAVVAAVGAITAAVTALGLRGADVNDAAETLDEFAGSAENAEEILKNLQEGTRGTVDEFVLMGSAARVMQAHVKLSADEFTTLGEAAFVMANRGLGSVESNLETINNALITGRTRSLAMKLGVVETKDATEEYARSLGKAKEDLSQVEHAEANRLAVMRILAEATKSNAGIQNDFNDRIRQAEVLIKDWIDDLARAVDNSKPLAIALDGVGKAITEAFGGHGQQLIDVIILGINHLAVVLVDAGIAAVEVARVFHVGWSVIETSVLLVTSTVHGLVSALFTALAAIDSLASKLAPGNKELRDMAARAKALADSWNAETDSLNEQTKAAALGIIGQSEYDKKLDHLGGTLMNVRDDTIKAMNATKDQTKAVQALIQYGPASEEFFKRQAKAAEEAAAAQKKYNDSVNDLVKSLSGAGAIAKANMYVDALARTIPIAQMTRDKQEEIHKAVDGAIMAYDAMGKDVPKALSDIWFETQRLIEQQPKLGGAVAGVGATLERLYSTVIPQALLQIPTIATLLPKTTLLERVGKTVHDSLIGPLSAVEEVLGGIQTKWAQMATVATRAILAISQRLSQGDWVGAIVAGVAAVGNFIVGMFHDVEEQVNPVRQAFIDAAGGLDALNQKAYAAGTTLTAVLDARTPEAYKAAIDDLNESLQFQDDAMKFLDDTTKKYGITIGELGPQFAQQKLDEQAEQLTKEFYALEAAGVGVDVITNKMGDSLISYTEQAIETGSSVPRAMHDIIQEMVNQGKILDANGNAYKTLEDTGLTFSETMVDATHSLIDEIKKLVDAITRGLGTAIANIPNPEVTGHVHWNVDPLPQGATEIQGMARGGVVYASQGFSPQGTDTVPAMLTPGERVLTVQQNKDYERKADSGGDDLGDRMMHLMRHIMPGLLADAMTVAMVKSGTRH